MDANLYEVHATVQRQCAIDLVNMCAPSTQQISSVLDIGCGTGFVSRALMTRFRHANYTLCDISPEMIRFCRNVYPNAQVLLCNAEEYAFGQRYDLVISNLAAHWFRDVEAFVLKMLKHSGCVVFSTLLRGSFESFFKLFEGTFPMDMYAAPMATYATRDEISQIFDRHSLKATVFERDYEQKFANPYMAALHFRNIGIQFPGNLRNAFVFKANSTPITLEYKALFVRVDA
ncbi:MAG: methyltransferase domain-containing protein [Holosporales bacterium]|jgi:trans-aconitate methyltransferase|nr:methyltransferase domain-containing protein [Holosporales bacterium]